MLPYLSETGWNHDGARKALLTNFFHSGNAEFRGDRKYCHVDLAGDVLHALVGFLAEDLIRLWIDGVELTLVAAIDDVLHHRIADFPLAVGGPDDRYGLRIHDVLHRGYDIFLAGAVDFFLRGKIDRD